jgi:hypothetical protein
MPLIPTYAGTPEHHARRSNGLWSTVFQGGPISGDPHYHVMSRALYSRQAVEMLLEKIHRTVQCYPRSAPVIICGGSGSMLSLS